MNIGEKKEFVGYVNKYDGACQFETDKTVYSKNVVLAIDELLRTEAKDVMEKVMTNLITFSIKNEVCRNE